MYGLLWEPPELWTVQSIQTLIHFNMSKVELNHHHKKNLFLKDLWHCLRISTSLA